MDAILSLAGVFPLPPSLSPSPSPPVVPPPSVRSLPHALTRTHKQKHIHRKVHTPFVSQVEHQSGQKPYFHAIFTYINYCCSDCTITRLWGPLQVNSESWTRRQQNDRAKMSIVLCVRACVWWWLGGGVGWGCHHLPANYAGRGELGTQTQTKQQSMRIGLYLFSGHLGLSTAVELRRLKELMEYFLGGEPVIREAMKRWSRDSHEVSSPKLGDWFRIPDRRFTRLRMPFRNDPDVSYSDTLLFSLMTGIIANHTQACPSQPGQSHAVIY